MPDKPAPEDDAKAKFKEALERKSKKAALTEDHKTGHGLIPHQNAKTQRQFRRKSGG